MESEVSQQKDSALVHVKTNVHKDDIHGICVQDQVIISGSKDTSIKMFDLSGEFKKELSNYRSTNNRAYSYNHWVTALDIFVDGSVVAGHRDNYLLCKNIYTEEMYYSDIFSVTPQLRNNNDYRGQYYKVKNEDRITGIKCLNPTLEKPSYSALIGMPEKFYEFDFDSLKITRACNFGAPEWAYGFSQVDEERITAIHGARLSLFKAEDDKWILQDTIVQEDRRLRPKQRPFISAVSPMGSVNDVCKSKVSLSFFGGTTRIVDINSKRVIFEGKEHSERVWQALPFSHNEYVSCADDKMIKIWDIRIPNNKSVHTYSGHPGRVSSLAFIGDLSFVAGTCAENPKDDPYKGQFYFYDMRKSSYREETRNKRFSDDSVNPSLEDTTECFAKLKLSK